MNCLAILCGLYIEAAVMAINERPLPPPPSTHWLYDRTHYRNPYGTIAVGLEYEPRPGVRMFGELRHESAIGTREDGGEDSVRVGVRWYPWRRP
jgi:hypothetical protein